MTSGRSLGAVLVIAAACLWGSVGTLQTLLPEGRDPFVVAALRLAFGAASLALLALAWPASRRAFGRLPLSLILFAGVAIAAFNLLFFWAALEAGVGAGAAIAIGSAPIWATGYEVVALGRRPRPRRAAALGASILGVALLAGPGAAGGGLGAGLAALAGAAYAAYSLATSRMGGRAPPATIAAATIGVAALVTAPALLVAPIGWVRGPEAWLVILVLGFGATGLSYALYTSGLTRVAASTAVTLALAEPVTAWLLAVFVVGEEMTMRTAAGALLILAGLAVVAAFPAQEPGAGEMS